MPLGKIHNQGNLGFRNFVRKDANDSDAFFVNGQHQFNRLRVRHAKETFQHVNNEFHRGEIVIQDQNLVHRGPFGFRARVKFDADFTVVVLIVLRHRKEVSHCGNPLLGLLPWLLYIAVCFQFETPQVRNRK